MTEAIDPIAIARQAFQAAQQRMQLIGMNAANVSTPSYQRRLPLAFPQLLSPAAATPLSNPLANQPNSHSATGAAPIWIDTRPGTLKPTGRMLDLALASPGYFVVRTEQGMAYTRAGQFSVNAAGLLVNPQGYPVQGDAGDIVIGPRQVNIDAQGRMFDRAEPPGTAAFSTLRIVHIPDPSQTLVASGDGLWQSRFGQDFQPLVDTETTADREQLVRVQQGFVENANVSHAREMSDLMQVMRQFESLQKAVQIQDDMVGSGIRRFGDTP